MSKISKIILSIWISLGCIFAHAAQTTNVEEIKINSTLAGEWTTSSIVSPQRVESYSKYYTFNLTESTLVNIGLHSEKDTYLYLLNESGYIIEEDDDGAVNTDSQIFVELEAGQYTIDATTYAAEIVGVFELSLTEYEAPTIASIALNSSIIGVLTENSGVSPRSQEKAEYYTFTLTEETEVVISVSAESDMSLYLLDENGETLEYRHNNRSIVKKLGVGTYTIDVSRGHISELGHFTLELKENIVHIAPITLNSSIEGNLTDNSGFSPRSQEKAEYYTFTLTEETEVVITVSAASDIHLYLLDANGVELESGYYNRSIVKKLGVGTYTVDVSREHISELGHFTLELKENIVHTTNIPFNTRIAGEWTENSGFSARTKLRVEYYTFSLTENRTVQIYFDLALNNYTGNYFYVLNENGDIMGEYEYIYSPISIDLEAGNYTIEMSNEKLEKFHMMVRRDIFIPNPVTQINNTNINTFASTITWNNIDTNVVGYQIYLNAKLVATVYADAGMYTFSGLDPDHEYTYSIRAYNSIGMSDAFSGIFTTLKDNYNWLIPIYGLLL